MQHRYTYLLLCSPTRFRSSPSRWGRIADTLVQHGFALNETRKITNSDTRNPCLFYLFYTFRRQDNTGFYWTELTRIIWSEGNCVVAERLSVFNERFHVCTGCALEKNISNETVKKVGSAGWKEEFVRGCHRYILHLRFDGNTRKRKLTLDFKVKQFFLFALYSTHRESETFPRNHRSQVSSFLEKWPQSFLIISHYGCVRSNSDFMFLERVECLYF